MRSDYKKKKQYRRRNRRYHSGDSRRRRYHLPRWCSRFLLPLVLVLWLASLAFPDQTGALFDALDTRIAAPICEHVLKPFVLEPFEEHVRKPLDKRIFRPLEEHILEPADTYIWKPLNRYVLKPLGRYVGKPLDEYVFTPVKKTVHNAWNRYVSTPFRARLHYPAQILAGSGKGSGEFEIHFLDVGQGLSVLVKSGEHALLYDGGDRAASSFVVSYLKQEGVTQLDYLIASHYDADHLSGLIGVLRTTPVTTVIGPDYVHDSNTYTSFCNMVAATKKTVNHPTAGSTYLLGDSYFTVVAPQKITNDSNNNSIAIRIVNGENSFLLTGDAEEASEEAMCSSGFDLYSDVICPGHHGSSTATTSLFLSYTQPDWAVISVGKDNDYGHPHRETLQRLEDAGVQVMRTDQRGTIIASSDGKTIRWNTDR